jgi:hypothetical protein
MKKRNLGALALLLMTGVVGFSQGCSDAGFCTLNSFKPQSSDQGQSPKNQLKVGIFYGQADYDIAVYGSYIEYNRQLAAKWSIDAKLTSLAQNGNEITTFGLADVFLNTNYKANNRLSFTLGTKIPLAQADKTSNNLPLPMDYQASLGTFDIIVGMGYQYKKWQFVTAFQQPLTQNENAFTAALYPLNHPLRAFQSTANFKRAGDVLVRVSYPFELTPQLRLTTSLLPIYHLANDRYTTVLNQEIEIEGSQGLTLNGNLFLDYSVTKNSSLQLNMGVPFIVREARPEGLTRGFIANLEYLFRF